MLRKFSFPGYIAALLLVFSCQKSGDNPVDQPVDPPAVASSDSIYLLKSISGVFVAASRTDFTYDNKHNLIKIDEKVNWTKDNGSFIFYKDGKVSHAVCQTGKKKFSIILKYNAAGKCKEVFYKDVQEDMANDNPYFTDLNDDNVRHKDSLLYNNSNQLEAIHVMSNYDTSIVKFFYPATNSKAAEKLEIYIKKNGSWILNDQLLLSTNEIDHPASKVVWYYPFLSRASGLPGGPHMGLPYLYNDPSTSLDFYLALVPKCITHYEVHNNWGVYNYKDTYYKYEFSKDSLRLTCTQTVQPFPSHIYYDFEKVKLK